MITMLKRRHRTLEGAGLAQGCLGLVQSSRQETRSSGMKILMASGRSWRIESVRTLGYRAQEGGQVRMEGMVSVQLRTQ